MKIIGWVLVLAGAFALAWALGVLAGKLPGPVSGALPVAVLGAIVFVAGWAFMRLSRRR
jgi:hypothetical protein